MSRAPSEAISKAHPAETFPPSVKGICTCHGIEPASTIQKQREFKSERYLGVARILHYGDLILCKTRCRKGKCSSRPWLLWIPLRRHSSREKRGKIMFLSTWPLQETDQFYQWKSVRPHFTKPYLRPGPSQPKIMSYTLCMNSVKYHSLKNLLHTSYKKLNLNNQFKIAHSELCLV